MMIFPCALTCAEYMVFSSVVHQGVEYQAEGGDTRHHAKQSYGLQSEGYDLHGHADRKSTRLNPVTDQSRMPSSA